MRLADISLDDVRAGTNWRLQNPDVLFEEGRSEDLEVRVLDRDPDPDDFIVYSGVLVTRGGSVRPMLLVRGLGEGGYGGDYYDYRDGRWARVDIVDDPREITAKEFVADPLAADPSFDSDEEDSLRTLYREEFRRLAGEIG